MFSGNGGLVLHPYTRPAIHGGGPSTPERFDMPLMPGHARKRRERERERDVT